VFSGDGPYSVLVQRASYWGVAMGPRACWGQQWANVQSIESGVKITLPWNFLYLHHSRYSARASRLISRPNAIFLPCDPIRLDGHAVQVCPKVCLPPA
jgi:hypothetical protein